MLDHHAVVLQVHPFVVVVVLEVVLAYGVGLVVAREVLAVENLHAWVVYSSPVVVHVEAFPRVVPGTFVVFVDEVDHSLDLAVVHLDVDHSIGLD